MLLPLPTSTQCLHHTPFMSKNVYVVASSAPRFTSACLQVPASRVRAWTGKVKACRFTCSRSSASDAAFTSTGNTENGTSVRVVLIKDLYVRVLMVLILCTFQWSVCGFYGGVSFWIWGFTCCLSCFNGGLWSVSSSAGESLIMTYRCADWRSAARVGAARERWTCGFHLQVF